MKILTYLVDFYFRNVVNVICVTGLTGYLGGRTFEYFTNKWYFRDMIRKYAIEYNISDLEVDDLHRQIQEKLLIKNKEEQKAKGGTLDNIKFKGSM